jgi:hypothetical protein
LTIFAFSDLRGVHLPFINRYCFVILAFMSGTVATAANLVTNPGFETRDFTGWSLAGNLEGGPPIYNPVSGATDGNQYYGVTLGNSVYPAHSGAAYAYFGVDSSPILLSQTISTTPGTLYEIDFSLANDYSPSNDYQNFLTVSFGSGASFMLRNIPGTLTTSAGETYVAYSFAGFATGTATVLQLSAQNGAGYFSLDDISVQPAPEPASWLLVACVLGGFWLYRAGQHAGTSRLIRKNAANPACHSSHR